jgi:hypothetical protein
MVTGLPIVVPKFQNSGTTLLAAEAPPAAVKVTDVVLPYTGVAQAPLPLAAIW